MILTLTLIRRKVGGEEMCAFSSVCALVEIPHRPLGRFLTFSTGSNWNWHFVQESVTSSPVSFLGILLNLIDWSSFESMELQGQYMCPEMRYMAVMLKLSRWFFGRFDYWWANIAMWKPQILAFAVFCCPYTFKCSKI